jgi:hypothetical protein
VTITVEITPEVQAELARQAAERGRVIEAHVSRLLEEAAHRPAQTEKKRTGKRLVEVCALVKGLTDDVDFSRDPSTDRPVNLR